MNLITKILLTIENGGRLGTTVSNTSSKKEIRKIMSSPSDFYDKQRRIWVSPKNQYKSPSRYQERNETECVKKINITQHAYDHFISSEAFTGISKNTWSKFNTKARLEWHLNQLADGNNYTYEILD